ncbi:OsmC family protein [Paenibacillus taichungensis]|uniref:OsmC family protein n=1 Tax=Paenibacillus taichungensis TaxID=484184 RepID=A0ABX2MSB8_9BACL|nr:OsmC family protein [Paenibacillus taichungensis]NUU56938.1 OsmC family protein [Paenibacillus taichungensis]
MNTNSQLINGINVDALKQFAGAVVQNSNNGIAKFQVTTEWNGGTKSASSIKKMKLGEQKLERDFEILIDEPAELLGENLAANPQEYLLAALNACMIVGYVAAASLENVHLKSLRIETKGQLDLRGFLGLDENIKPGYEELQYTVVVSGDGTQEQWNRIHETVKRTSPNRWNIANAIQLNSEFVVE